jgi:hypothetical protein
VGEDHEAIAQHCPATIKIHKQIPKGCDVLILQIPRSGCHAYLWHQQQILDLITLCKETVHGSPMGESLSVANTAQLGLEMETPGIFTNVTMELVAPYLSTHAAISSSIQHQPESTIHY